METQVNNYFIPVKKFKRGYLEIPSDFREFLGSDGNTKEPLWFIDDDEERHIVEYFADRNLLGGLGEWYRKYDPKDDSIISLRPHNMGNREFRMSLNTGSSKQVVDGLFIGKEYSTVGAKKYELKNDYHFLPEDLTKHVFICGITGSGKTVLGKSIIEEAVMKGIPSILIDLKGDLSSMALVLTSMEDFKEWTESSSKGKSDQEAEKQYHDHYDQLSKFGITKEKVEEYKKRADFRIFTPRSKKGIPIAFGSPLGAPPDSIELYKNNPDEFNNFVNTLTGAFIDRLYPGKKRSKIENERNYLYEIVHYAWLNGIGLKGAEGMRRLLKLIIEPPFEEIGGLQVGDYIDAENRRKRLINKVNTLLSGPETMWFKGDPFNMESMLGAEDDKVPVNIINLVELDHFEDRNFVVAQITYEIQKWMRKQKGTTAPRIIFFIDEIGDGGGKQALFPSFPYECAAKWGLNYLVRQGRSFGVCCIFATQNPGDIDYKGLGQCNTWIMGKLPTDRDRKKAMEGMEVWGLDADRIKHNLATAGCGDFVVKDAKSKIKFIKERWLMSYHRRLTISEVETLMKRKQVKG